VNVLQHLVNASPGLLVSCIHGRVLGVENHPGVEHKKHHQPDHPEDAHCHEDFDQGEPAHGPGGRSSHTSDARIAFNCTL